MRILHIGLMSVLLSLGAQQAGAHYWWILATSAGPAPGESVRLEVGGGHGFPESDTLLAERLLHAARVVGPGMDESLTFVAGDTLRVADVSLPESGVYRAEFEVQRPGDARPLIMGRTLILTGDGDDVDAYATGEGLEIVPTTKLSAWAKGEDLQLEVRLDGEVVPAMIRLERAGERPVRLRTAPGRPADFTRWVEGPSLFVVEHEGQTVTLTVRPLEED